MMNEMAQQEASRVQGRVQAAMEALLAAQAASARLVALGGPDYGERIQQALVPVTSLTADITIAIGEVVPHRGLRTPPTCDDPNCPIHGDPPIEMTRCGVKNPRPSCDKQ